MNLFEFFQYIGWGAWLYGGALILVLSILIFIHEMGHYLVARWCNVRVETFSIGFGKELFGRTSKDGTHWKVSLIPLGGYVKLYGDTDPASSGYDDTVEGKKGKKRKMTKKEKDVAFFNKPVWQRAAIVFAGPAINYIFAILILALLFAFNGKPMTPPVAGAVVGGSSAEAAGFEPHDIVVSIDGTSIQSFEDIRREMMISLDTEKHFVVQRGANILDIHATPTRQESTDRFGFKHSRGVLGLMGPESAIDIEMIQAIDGRSYDDVEKIRGALQRKMGRVIEIDVFYENGDDDFERSYIVKAEADYNESLGDSEAKDHNLLYITGNDGKYFVKYGPIEAVGRAVGEAWSITTGTLEAIGQIIVGTRSTKELGGLVRIGAMAGDMAQQGLVALVLFTALLSINLGLINLFPIPLLDGGHLVFYAVEAVVGKPIPEQIQDYAFRGGFVFLIAVMLFANANDILQLILH